MTAWPGPTIADGRAALDRLVARARCVVEDARLPADLGRDIPPIVLWEAGGVGVLTTPSPAESEPQALSASYNPADDVTDEEWFVNTPDREERRQKRRSRYGSGKDLRW